MTDANGIQWEGKDKMSLFHDGHEGEDAETWQSHQNFFDDVKVYQRNAIYAAQAVEGGKQEYATAAWSCHHGLPCRLNLQSEGE